MTNKPCTADPAERLLTLAPTRKDARLTCEILQRNGIACLSCADLPELCSHLQEGAAGVLVAEECFATADSKRLLRFLAEQQPWSDLPLILLTRRGSPSAMARKILESLGNVLLLERPTQTSMLVSAARAALRDRRRQYALRNQLQELQRRRAALKENEKALIRAKQEADDANRAKSEFLANMSHDIRTPMTITLGALDLLADTELEGDQVQLLEMAATATHNLLGLINDILDFARIEARKLDLHPQPSSVRLSLEMVAQQFTLEAQRKGLALTVEVVPDAPESVVVDPDRLNQILINLVGNALKFTEQGRITLGAAPSERGLRFFVRDTGSGIAAEILPDLFESFTQATREHGGTGLGLSICKGLVELMGGEIGAESRPGEGSTFHFTLPLPAAPTEAAPSEAELVSSGALAPLGARILLAEDEPALQRMIALLLKKWRCEVTQAGTGEEAVRHWEKGGCDLILMDLQMPQMGGIEASRLIREKELETGMHTPIVALTARARPEDEQQCLDAGMDAWLPKPINHEHLHALISRLMMASPGK